MIRASIKRSKSNAKRIVGNVRRNKIRLLNEFGENLADIAEASMQRVAEDSDSTSRPNSPPFIRSPAPNLATIRKYVDPAGRFVVAGPVKTPSSANIGAPTPGIVERGGMVVKRTRSDGGRGGQVIRYRVQKRPFIRPAAIKAIRILRANVRSRGIAK